MDNVFSLRHFFRFKINLLKNLFFLFWNCYEKLQCITSTKYIILNVKDIIILDFVTVEKEEEIPESPDKAMKYDFLRIADQFKRKEKEWHVIQLKEELKVNEKIRVSLHYTKMLLLRDPDIAFIRYSYTTEPINEEK